MSEFEGMTHKEIQASEKSDPLSFDDWFAEHDAETLRDYISLCFETSNLRFKEYTGRTNAWAAGSIEMTAKVQSDYKTYCKEVLAGERGA